MKRLGAIFSLCEQGMASGFTLLLFLTAVRVLEADGLSVFSGLFSLNQSFLFFLFGLVLFPVSSASGEDSARQLGMSLVLLAGLLLAFAVISPAAMQFFTVFKGGLSWHLWLLAVAFFLSQCFYETGRWLVIRLRGARRALPATGIRFASVFLLIAWQSDSGSGFTLAVTAANVLSACGYLLILRRSLHGLKPVLPDRGALRHAAIFGTSVANFAVNFATTALIDRSLGGGGLAAFQALRSLTNPIGAVSQILDNHFSAHLARTGGGVSRAGRVMLLALPAAAGLVLAAALAAPWLVPLLLAPELAGHWLLLPLLLAASLTHVLTRPVVIGWRLSGNTRCLNIFSLLLLGGVLPVIAGLGLSGWPMLMTAVFALQPAVCLLAGPLLNCRSQRASP